MCLKRIGTFAGEASKAFRIPPSDGPLKVFGHPIDCIASQVNDSQHLQAAHQVNHLLDPPIWKGGIHGIRRSHDDLGLLGTAVVSQILGYIYSSLLLGHFLSQTAVGTASPRLPYGLLKFEFQQ